MLTRVSWLIPAAIAFGSHAAYAQQGCENLVNLKLPYTTPSPAPTMAMKVAAGRTGPSDIRRH